MVEPFTLTILGITYTFSNVCLAILASSAATSIIVTVSSISYYNVKQYIARNYKGFCTRTYSSHSSNKEAVRAYWNMIYCLSFFSKKNDVKHTMRIKMDGDVEILVCADLLCMSNEKGGYFTDRGRKKVRIYYHGATGDIVMMCKYGSQIDDFENLFSKKGFIDDKIPDIYYVGVESTF